MSTKLSGLRHLAARIGLSLGCHPDWDATGKRWEPIYLLQKEFDTLVANSFHWSALQPHGPDSWEWEKADLSVQLAHEIGLSLRGHAILWYQMVPDWFTRLPTLREQERALRNHIRTLVERYRGRIISWDVFNEPIWLEDKRPGGLREDFLFRTFGEEVLDLAFHTAAEADPGAELVLNEALLVHAEQENRRRAFLDLAHRLLDRGVPVHAAGIQAHIGWDDGLPMGPLDPDATARCIRSLGKAGLAVKITELDVLDAAFSADEEVRDKEVAATYTSFLEAILGEESLRGLVFWGCGDKGSWYNSYVKRVFPERLPSRDWLSRPLLFDQDFHPKPAYFAVADALAGARISPGEENPYSCTAAA